MTKPTDLNLQTENESLRAMVAELEEANDHVRIQTNQTIREWSERAFDLESQLTQLRRENHRLKEELLTDNGYLACECGRLLSDEVDFSHCDCGKAVDEIFPHVKPKNMVAQIRREIEAMREDAEIGDTLKSLFQYDTSYVCITDFHDHFEIEMSLDRVSEDTTILGALRKAWVGE